MIPSDFPRAVHALDAESEMLAPSQALNSGLFQIATPQLAFAAANGAWNVLQSYTPRLRCMQPHNSLHYYFSVTLLHKNDYICLLEQI